MKEASIHHRNWTRLIIWGLMLGLVVLGSVTLYQQQTIASLDNNLASDHGQIANLQNKVSRLQLPLTPLTYLPQYGPALTSLKTNGSPYSAAIGPDGTIYYASLVEADKCHANDSIWQVTSNGTRLVANDAHASSMAVDKSGTLYWMDVGGCGGKPGIYKVSQSDLKTTLVTSLPDCPFNQFFFGPGCSLAVDSDGTLYIAKNNTIFKLPTGSTKLETVYAGNQPITDLAVRNGIIIYSIAGSNISWLGPPYTSPSSDWPFGGDFPKGFISNIGISPSGQWYFLDSLGAVYSWNSTIELTGYHDVATFIFQICLKVGNFSPGSNCGNNGFSVGSGEIVAADYLGGILTVYRGVDP